MGKERCKKNHLKPELEINGLRSDHETDEYWKLRREFLVKNYEKVEKNKLISLSHTYINIRVLGCRYPDALMTRVAEMSEGLSVDWCGGWINRRLVQTGTKYVKKYGEVPAYNEDDDTGGEELDDAVELRPTWQKRPILDHQKHFVRDMLTDSKSDNIITCKGDAKKISKKVEQETKKENIKPTGDEEILSRKERKRQEKTVKPVKVQETEEKTKAAGAGESKMKKGVESKSEAATSVVAAEVKKKKKSKTKEKTNAEDKIQKKPNVVNEEGATVEPKKKEKKVKSDETSVKAEEVKIKKITKLKVKHDTSESPVVKPKREKKKDKSETCKGGSVENSNEKKPKEKSAGVPKTAKKTETKEKPKDGKKKKKDGK